MLTEPKSNICSDGYIGITPAAPLSRVELVYSVQPLDWAGRVLALFGLAGLAGLVFLRGGQVPWIGAGILNRRERRLGSDVTGIGV